MANHQKTKQKPAAGVNFDEEIAELHTLLRALGEEAIMMRNGGKLAEKEHSYSGNIITEADKLLEEEIVKRLRMRHPDHRIRGEEGGVTGPAESRYEWVVNPIDGTTNFSKGLKFFSIAVALMEDGKPVMGVIYFPELSRFVHAVKGGGAFENGQPFATFARPAVHKMKQALVAGATTRRKGGRFPVLESLRMDSLNLVNTGSMTYNCILLAEGKIDASVHTDASIFHIAAAIPVLEEIGCAVLGFETEQPDLTQENIPIIFADNQELAEDIRKSVLAKWEGAEK